MLGRTFNGYNGIFSGIDYHYYKYDYYYSFNISSQKPSLSSSILSHLNVILCVQCIIAYRGQLAKLENNQH